MKQHYFTIFMLVASTVGLSAQVYVKHDATGTNNGTSWANAYTSLQAALGTTTAGQVWVAAGTYRPTLSSDFFNVKNGVAMYGGFAGTETSLGQRNPLANVTVLSGDLAGNDVDGVFATNRTDNALHVVSVDNGIGAAAVVDGFTISGGNAIGTGNNSGGGILAQGPVVVRQCNLNNNFASTGGAIFLASTAAGSEIKRCNLSKNLSSGALYLLGVDGVDVDSSTFTNNTNQTINSNAAAFFALNCTNLTLSNSELADNTGPVSGALYYDTDGLAAVTNADNFVITNCHFHDNLNNSAAPNTNGIGGAARFRNGSYTLLNCIFEDNTSVSSGGHIRNDVNADDNVVYTDCTFKNGNSGGWGGALTAYGGTFTVTDCIFENNICGRLGGAVNNGFGGTMTYTDCTFLNNHATGTASGGALGLQNDLTTVNAVRCNFSGNTADGSGGAIFSGANASSSPVNVDDCLFEGNMALGFGGAISIADNGPNNNATLSVANSIFNFNSAVEQGGAINISNANTTITSSLFTNNIATSGMVAPTGRGGAISINVDSTTLDASIMNSTFAANIGEFAAIISSWVDTSFAAASNTILQNNIFASEGGIAYAIELGAPEITSNGGNLFDDDSFDDYLTHPKDLKVADASDVFIDPDDDNYRLKNGSVAVDAGVDAGAPAFDIEGNPRLNEVDMGAYENQFVSKVDEVLLANDGILLVSPNPAAGESTTVTLDNLWAGDVQLRLTNQLGQEVRTYEVKKSAGKMNFDLPLNGLGQGIYQLAASNGSQVVVMQFVRN